MKRLFMVFVILCAMQAATAWAASFTNNGNGTVTDNGTGLMWQQGESGSMTWANALTYCEGLSLGEQTDWRLPNVKELESITDDTKYNPAIGTTYFPNANAYYYWSSTTYAGYTDYAWVVYFGSGGGSSYYKSYGSYVRCVRGGQAGLLCNLAIFPSTQTFTSIGGTGTVTVTASDSACAWTASSSLDWVTITSGSGTGSGTATISVSANTTGATRTGNIDIADQTFLITQSAVPSCTFTLKPASKSFNSRKGNVVVDVKATGNSCTLSPTESYDWITAALSGKFTQDKKTKKWSGKVKVEVTENKSSAARTGTVDIGGQTFTVTQSGVPCTLKISPETTKKPLAGAGGTDSFKVTTPDGCNWTATPDKAAWLTISSGSSGSGNGTVEYTASENTTGKKRTSKINVVTSDKKGKKTFTVNQDGAPTVTGTVDIPNLAQPSDTDAKNENNISMHLGEDWTSYASKCLNLKKQPTWSHTGIDIKATNNGDVVYAAEAGEVKVSQSSGPKSKWKDFITLEHKDSKGHKYTTVYWHLANRKVEASTPKKTVTVTKGQPIAEVADMGGNTHLHFGIRSAPYDNTSNRGGLPNEKVSSCCTEKDTNGKCTTSASYPAYKDGNFVNPLDYFGK